MTLFLVRHGETDYNRQNIVQGSGVDSDLNAKGQKQARLLYKYYRDVSFDAIFISALKRTRQTLEHFILKGDALLMETPDLNEISWGVHEGLAGNANSHSEFKNLMLAWEAGEYEARLTKGESAAELYERTSRVVAYLKENYQGKNVLICTHGRTLLCLITILKNLPLSKMVGLKHQNTCVYRAYFVEDEFHFDMENDTRHLGTPNL